MSDNKNSFRDMILIIFVVLICFGVTIYGIAYLTEKVFSESAEVEVSPNDVPKEVSTNPQDGDTLTFTTMQDQGDEVTPDMDNIITTTTPPAKDMQEAEVDINEAEVAVEEDNNNVEQMQAAAEPKNEEVKQVAASKPQVKEVAQPEPKKVEQKKAEPKKVEPKKEEVKKVEKPAEKKDSVKTVPPKVNGNFVVQIAAVQSKESAENELKKYRSKFPDVFIKQVQINGKTWYRVRLGVSATREEAEQKAKRVEQEFKIKPIVTKNN